MTEILSPPRFDAHQPENYSPELYAPVGTAKAVCGFDAGIAEVERLFS